MKNGNKSQFKVLFGVLPQVYGYRTRQEVGQVLFGDYACMLCCAVLCYAIFSSFTLFLPCECVCIYYLHVTAEGQVGI